MIYYCDMCGSMCDSDATVPVDAPDGSIICEDCSEESGIVDQDDWYAEG